MDIPDCNEPPMSRVITREWERSGQKERWPHSTRAEFRMVIFREESCSIKIKGTEKASGNGEVVPKH